MITRRGRRQLLAPSDAYDLAAQVADLQMSLERDLLAAVLCDVCAGVSLCRRLGVSTVHFMQPDLRLIWCACEVCARIRRPQATLRMARLALETEKFCSRGGIWTVAKLEAFARSFCAFRTPMQKYQIRLLSPRLVEGHAALVRMDHNQRDTLRHLLDVTRPRRKGRAA